MSLLLVKSFDGRKINVDRQPGWIVKDIVDAVETGLGGTFKLFFKVA
jgi:hypothetical protein